MMLAIGLSYLSNVLKLPSSKRQEINSGIEESIKIYKSSSRAAQEFMLLVLLLKKLPKASLSKKKKIK